jgi:hypothetical protein
MKAGMRVANLSLDVVGVNESVSVVLQCFFTVQNCFWCAAKFALGFTPSVLDALEPDVAIVAGERFGDGVAAGGVLGTIHAPACQQAREVRGGDAEHLPGQDVVHPLLQIGNLLLQSLVEALGNLAQETAGFGAGVEEP